MSRLQPSSPSESPKSASPGPSDQRGELSEQPSSSTHPRMSEGSEGYPSWLPKRPPPPDPGSTVHSSNGVHTPGLTPIEPFNVGRKPTPRSVRVVSLQDATQPGRDQRDITEQSRFSNPLRPRVWSRATTAGVSQTLVSAAVHAQDRAIRPKFNSNGLHPELLRNPTLSAKLYFYLFPLFTFYHIPLQTFFDFNAVFMLLQCVLFLFILSLFLTRSPPPLVGSQSIPIRQHLVCQDLERIGYSAPQLILLVGWFGSPWYSCFLNLSTPSTVDGVLVSISSSFSPRTPDQGCLQSDRTSFRSISRPLRSALPP